ncbi:MAG: IS30 family transposase [Ectothiorhodospiraceae bacterium]|nr:IS30 family transposase [Ectothiorhodospiraceae bacterium]MBN4053061.1 IS30 family transposase [Gammaproteobacteria bacterium AH-315-K14]
MKPYKQLTYEQRCQIYVLKKRDLTQQAIADAIGVSQAAISREFKRNSGKRGYRYQQAQSMSDERRAGAAKAIKMTPDMIHFIESKLRKKWSPEQISGWLLEEQAVLLSHETLYQHIWSDKAVGGELYCHLRRQGKAYHPRGKSMAGRGHIKNRISIDERPAIVDERGRLGDWEIDLVIGKGHSGALVTIVERETSFTVSKRIHDKSAKTVTAATIALLKPYKEAVHTITADNGKEFAYHEQVTAALNAPVYFADPYSSWQRGLNENTNGLLRQYWPKSTDFKKISANDVTAVIIDLNDRPRKKLGYKTPARLMREHMAAIAA